MKNYFPFLSGVFASLGSLFGKLSGEKLCDHSMLAYVIQAACFALMIFLNTAMWTYYVKALQASSSYKATVLSAATNYLLSGLFGVFFFGELTGVLWWSGISLVLFGLVLIQTSKDSFKDLNSTCTKVD